jgi:hypothetical protein
MEYMNRPEYSGAAFWRTDARQEAGEPYPRDVHPKGEADVVVDRLIPGRSGSGKK